MDMHRATLYLEPLNAKEKGMVDGVSGATMPKEAEKGLEIPSRDERGYSNTRYALEAFHHSIINGDMPASNVTTGARAAIAVRLAVDAMREGVIKTWKEEYGV